MRADLHKAALDLLVELGLPPHRSISKATIARAVSGLDIGKRQRIATQLLAGRVITAAAAREIAQ
jgi:hypothetical protein